MSYISNAVQNSDVGGNATIGATTGGVAGPNIPCLFFTANVISTGTPVRARWTTAQNGGTAGGTEIVAGGVATFYVSNPNLFTFHSGSGTVTVNLHAYA